MFTNFNSTGGWRGSNLVQIWKLVQEKGKVKLVFMASLTRHSGAVNVVRFSPNGKISILLMSHDSHVMHT